MKKKKEVCQPNLFFIHVFLSLLIFLSMPNNFPTFLDYEKLYKGPLWH